MANRPNTPAKLLRKARRCVKCNKLIGVQKRCRTCHLKVKK